MGIRTVRLQTSSSVHQIVLRGKLPLSSFNTLPYKYTRAEVDLICRPTPLIASLKGHLTIPFLPYDHDLVDFADTARR
jgi:hypothetical protein